MKGFLRKVLLIASFGAALTFYGCNKDFTQDIEDVRNDLTTALEEQNSTLTAAINQAKEDAQKYADEAAKAAKDYADQVAAAAKAEAIEEAEKLADAALESAKTYADQVAKSEAAKVKQELLEQIKTDLENTLADAKKYTDEQIKDLKDELLVKITELSSRIDGIDEEINTLKSTVEAQGLKIDELVKADEAMKLRLDALEAFQKTMEDWKKTVETSLTELADADKALAEKIAAESARIDQLIKDLEDLETRLMALILKNQEDIAALQADVLAKYNDLQGKIDALKATMDQYKEELDAADQVLQDNIDQLGEDLRKEMAEAIDALDSELRTFIEAELADLKEYFDGEIAAVRKELSDKAAELYKYIDDEIAALDEKIAGIIDSVEETIKNRITSISLIPEMYIQGIESINVPVISYNAITVEKDETLTSSLNTNVLPWYATTPIRYHVSPSNVTADCIGAAEYLTENATIVKSAGSSVLNVAFDAIKINENNELVIPVSRVAAASKVFTVENFKEVSHANWPTVALSLGIAEKYLVDETSANVISEYSAYTETPYNIHITPAENSCTALECTYYYRTYADAINVENVANISRLYTETVNLRELVLSHIYSDKIVEEEDLKAMGLDYRFAIPTEPQEVGDNKTDQQKFIQFADENNELVKSTVPGGYADNEAAIGRTPVVRVELYDVNNGNIVDVQWIKIKWVKAQIPPQSFDNIKSFDSILDCSNLYEYKLDWATLNEKVLGAFKDENGEVTGISNKEFVDYYSNATLSIDYENSDFERYVSVSQNKDAFTSTEPTTNVYTVKVDYRGLAGILPEIIENGKATRKVTVKITPRTDKDFYVGVLSFSVTLNWTVVDLPTVRYNNVGNWTIKNTLAQIDPVGYDDAENNPGGVHNDKTRVRYNFEMLAGNGLFNPDASQNNRFITNLTTENEELDFSCRSWDMQFSPDRKGYGDYMQTVKPGFGFAYNFTKNTSDAGYRVGVSSIYMAKMVYRNKPTEFVNWYDPTDLTEDKITTIRFRLPDPNTYKDGDIQRARNLLNDLDAKPEDRVRIPVNVLVNITPDFTNVYTAATYDVWVVSPVKIDSLSLSGKEFEDWNKDKNTITFNGQPFGTDVKIKDFQGVVITSEQFEYYGIEQPTWNLSASQILTNVTVDADGNRVVDNSLNPNKGDVAKMWSASKAGFKVSSNTGTPSKYSLTVTNATGTQLTEDVTLWIKVTYKHAFRDYAYYIPVKYKKNENKPIDPIE